MLAAAAVVFGRSVDCSCCRVNRSVGGSCCSVWLHVDCSCCSVWLQRWLQSLQCCSCPAAWAPARGIVAAVAAVYGYSVRRSCCSIRRSVGCSCCGGWLQCWRQRLLCLSQRCCGCCSGWLQCWPQYLTEWADNWAVVSAVAAVGCRCCSAQPQ